MNTFALIFSIVCAVGSVIAAGLTICWMRQTTKSVREIERINGRRW